MSFSFLALVPAIWGLDLTEEGSADSPVTPTQPELQVQINPTFISLILAPGEAEKKKPTQKTLECSSISKSIHENNYLSSEYL